MENLTSSGSFVVNECVFQAANAQLPFGGVGYSGYGCFKGKLGFQSFSHQKSVMVKPTLNFGDFKSAGMHPFTPDCQKKVTLFMKLPLTQFKMIKYLKILAIILAIFAIWWKFA